MLKGDGHLSRAFLKHIGDYLLVETPLKRADICLIFGNNHADHLAVQAASLYKRGYFSRIIVSGGVATDDGRLEAHRMRDDLLALGVPAAAILVEDKATNSGENVTNSMELLRQRGELENIHSVLAIGHIQASRRFLMTLECHWPDVVKMFTTTNCYKAPKEKWYDDPAFRAVVLDEYAKIAPYKAKGFIREVDMKKINAATKTLPVPQKPAP